MDQSLRNVAKQGSIDALYALIQMDAKVLDSMDDIPFVETPLHIAASAGHTRFAMEVITLKPSFARKLNQHGFTPIHLALQKHHELENNPDLQRNQTQLVHRLLDVDKDIIRVHGREGVTPFHYVAQLGNLHFLAKFYEVCPESFEDVTNRRENILYVALKYDQVEAFRLLIGWIRRAWFKDAKLLEEKLLHWQDDEGNTLLHVAVSRNQPEVVSWLLDSGPVNLKAKNLEGDTVFDILEGQTQVDNQRIRDMLRQRCVTRLTARLKEYCSRRPPNNFRVLGKFYVRIRRQQTGITEDRRNALLVVAALLVTISFQASLSPDQQPNQFNCTVPINATGADHFICTARFDARSRELDPDPVDDFSFYGINTLTYYLTNVTLFFLVPPDFIGFVLYFLLLLLFYCYCFSTSLSSNAPTTSFIGFLFFFPLILFSWIIGRVPSKHFSSN